MPLRLVFMGSPDFALPSLAALRAAGHQIVCVYSQPPRPAGRGKTERATPVHVYAQAHALPARVPASLKSEAEQQAFAALGADAAAVVAYGLILPQAVLSGTRLGAFNLHASLLPRWRGAAPIQRAIMAGDAKTGVQVMRMRAGLDTGPVLASAETEIRDDDTAGSLHDRLAAMGGELLAAALEKIECGKASELEQSQEGVTYASKITAAETRIDWARPAAEVDCKIRGLSPYPGAWFEMGGQRFKALLSRQETGAGAPGELLDDKLMVACGEGAVRLLVVQREGRAALPAETFLRGAPAAAGIRLD